MGRLDGKVAVITGGASGMGAATVRRFVEEGARVVIADLQEAAGAALEAELGGDAVFCRTDVGREADVQAMIGLAVSRFGGLDILFNNAGFGGVAGPIDQTDMGEAYAITVAGLLTGPILGIKHAVAPMRARGGGSIISTASVAGLRGGMGPHVYSALKAAVLGLTRSVAVELAVDGIRVNAICPGGIMTPIFLGGRKLKAGANVSLEETLRPAFAQMQPIPRAGEPLDIANAALFLASDESGFITGHELVVDGGLTVGRRRTEDVAASPIFQAISQLVDEPAAG
jgi:NAD(P)-dependent dehydrogenase (short-subunit alcohol dehydrogenase family)